MFDQSKILARWLRERWCHGEAHQTMMVCLDWRRFGTPSPRPVWLGLTYWLCEVSFGLADLSAEFRRISRLYPVGIAA